MSPLDLVRVHLSPLDSAGVDTAAVALCYILQPTTPIDIDAIDRALGRVVDKWRLLAGRIESKKENGRWVLAVPTAKDLPADHKTYSFTSTTSTESLGIDLPQLTPSQATFQPALPNIKHFRSPGPATNTEFAKTQAPLVSVHVSVLADCTCVGLTLPHGVFDATGMGRVLHAINAELNGLPWTVPPLELDNVADAAMSKVVRRTDDILPPINRDMVHPTWPAFIWLLATVAYEILWQKSKTSSVYLGEEVVARIVDPVKAEVAKTKGEWVSTGDVLHAWLLKSAFLDEPTNPNIAHFCSGIAARSLFATASPSTSLANGTYPHNCVMYLFPPTIPVSELPSTSLATIALNHRKTINLARTPSFAKASLEWSKNPCNPAYPARSRGTDSLIFTNQVVGNLTSINWGSELKHFWNTNVPFMPDHAVSLNMHNGGYLLMGSMRTARWNAVASEVARLNGDGERRVV